MKNNCHTKYCRKPQQHGYFCYACKKREWRATHPLQDAFYNLRHSARRRDIPFLLSLVDFQTLSCRYDYLNRRGKQAHSFTVDRIDSSKGYALENLRVISNSDNVAKGNRERALDHVWRKICNVTKTENPF